MMKMSDLRRSLRRTRDPGPDDETIRAARQLLELFDRFRDHQRKVKAHWNGDVVREVRAAFRRVQVPVPLIFDEHDVLVNDLVQLEKELSE